MVRERQVCADDGEGIVLTLHPAFDQEGAAVVQQRAAFFKDRRKQGHLKDARFILKGEKLHHFILFGENRVRGRQVA